MASALNAEQRRKLALPGAEFLDRKLISPAGCFKCDLTAVYCGHDLSLVAARPPCDWRREITHLVRMSCRLLGGSIGRTPRGRALCDTAGAEERGNRDLIFD